MKRKINIKAVLNETVGQPSKRERSVMYANGFVYRLLNRRISVLKTKDGSEDWSLVITTCRSEEIKNESQFDKVIRRGNFSVTVTNLRLSDETYYVLAAMYFHFLNK